jgi:hypothetical protein
MKPFKSQTCLSTPKEADLAARKFETSFLSGSAPKSLVLNSTHALMLSNLAKSGLTCLKRKGTRSHVFFFLFDKSDSKNNVFFF